MLAAVILALAVVADPLHAPDSILDAGEVRVGPPLIRRFAFTNAGPDSLTITDVRSSCGCLVPTLAKRIYAPGEHGELTVEVNTLSQPVGAHRWAFHLNYQCGSATGEQTLELTARLMQEIEVNPAALAFRGAGEMTSRVTIHDPRPKPLRVRSVATSAPYLSATDYGPAIGDGNYSFGVRVGVDCPVGRHVETVTIATDDPDYREIKLPVTINCEPKLRVTATPARATLVAGGSALVQLRAADGTPVRVDTLEGSVPALTCRWAPGPADRATVRLGLDRGKWDGKPFTGEVRLRLSAPASEMVVIPVAVRPDE